MDPRIEAIRSEAKKNKAADAVFHMWASRSRARGSVTIGGLDQRMKAEGFEFDKAEYASILRLMAELGFGKLDQDSKGHVKALKDIRIKLQSIGQAAVGSIAKLDGWKARNKYRVIQTADKKVEQQAPAPTKTTTEVIPVSLTVAIHGKPVKVHLPSDLDDQEIAALVHRLRTG